MAITIDTTVSGHSDPLGEHPRLAEIELATVMQALSDPVRLQILSGLAGGAERSCKSFDLPVVKSTSTHHFRVLRDAGLIRTRQVGKTRLSSLRRDEFDERFPGLLDAVLAAATSAT
ncbi:MAG: ArsR/SmtB family transcription factor [Solirubrobacteraceae bacterium]